LGDRVKKKHIYEPRRVLLFLGKDQPSFGWPTATINHFLNKKNLTIKKANQGDAVE